LKIIEEQDKDSNGNCDFKIMVTWVGTDKNGKNLVSHSKTFQKYKNYNLKDRYERFL